MEKFSVYFTNFGYFQQDTFASLEEAVASGKRAGFEFSVYAHTGDNVYKDESARMIAAWSVFGGLRHYETQCDGCKTTRAKWDSGSERLCDSCYAD